MMQVDPGNTGKVDAAEAAQFLKKSGLSDSTLGQVGVRTKLLPLISRFSAVNRETDFLLFSLFTDLGFIRSREKRLP